MKNYSYLAPDDVEFREYDEKVGGVFASSDSRNNSKMFDQLSQAHISSFFD